MLGWKLILGVDKYLSPSGGGVIKAYEVTKLNESDNWKSEINIGNEMCDPWMLDGLRSLPGWRSSTCLVRGTLACVEGPPFLKTAPLVASTLLSLRQVVYPATPIYKLCSFCCLAFDF